MRAGLIALKLGMTRVYTAEGVVVPVTVLKVDNCQVVAQKTTEPGLHLRCGADRAQLERIRSR